MLDLLGLPKIMLTTRVQRREGQVIRTTIENSAIQVKSATSRL